jgi:alpha-1,2-mannosyltransferase
MLNRFLSDDLLRVPHFALLLLGVSVVSAGIYFGFNVPLGMFSQPMGMDFFCFWSAGRLALDGHAADIFNPQAMATFQQAYLQAPSGWSLPWFYPPLLLLMISCGFALLPFKLAYAAYLLISVGGYYALVRRYFPGTKPLYIASFPAFWFNLLSGQNGLLTAVILVGGLIALSRKEVTGGLILALLSYKPQLCLAIPAFLLIERRWSAIVTGLVTFICLVALSTLLWGLAIWPAFLSGLQAAQTFNQLGDSIRPDSLAHLYGTLRAVGFSHTPAFALNYLFAALAGCAAVRIWWLDVDQKVKNSCVILMSLLLPPHLMYYDLVATGAVILWLWPHERLRPALIILWCAPFLWPVFAKLGVPLFPLAAAMLLVQLNRVPNRRATVSAVPPRHHGSAR